MDPFPVTTAVGSHMGTWLMSSQPESASCVQSSENTISGQQASRDGDESIFDGKMENREKMIETGKRT